MIGALLAICVAASIVVWEPWHGPTLLSLSSTHGVDGGDLLVTPFVALALVLVSKVLRPAGGTSTVAGDWAGPVSAIVLGVLLLFAGTTGLMFAEVLVTAILGAACWFSVELIRRHANWLGARSRGLLSAIVLVAVGGLLDVADAPSGSTFCLVLLAAWFGATATDHLEAVVGLLMTVGLGVASLASLAAAADGDGGILTRAEGGVIRALALGAFLTFVGLLRIRYVGGHRR